ncbi:MAG: hypothetical protein ACE5HJ_05880 [Thermoplasmata archaeon]
MPPLPEPSEIPEAPPPLWFWVKEDLDVMKREMADLKKKVKGLEGRVSALEQMLRQK